MINKTALKTLSFSIITALMLSACGGSGSDNIENKTSESENNTNENTQPTTPTNPNDNSTLPTPPVTENKNILTFPVSQFKYSGVNLGTETVYSIWESYKVEINNLLSETISTIYLQRSDKAGWWWTEPEYILTKDKLYYAKQGQHPLYIVENTDSKLILGYDSNGTGLTQTITFKNIDLANEQLNSEKISTSLLTRVQSNDANFTQLKNAFSQLSDHFSEEAKCHQYLTHKYNQENIFFDANNILNGQKLEEWITSQKAKNQVVTEEIWAGYKIAYIPDNMSNHFLQFHRYGTSRNIVIEIDGKLYQGYFDNAKLYNYEDEYDYKTLAQFNEGVCDLYNESATQTLRTAIQSLPKN